MNSVRSVGMRSGRVRVNSSRRFPSRGRLKSIFRSPGQATRGADESQGKVASHSQVGHGGQLESETSHGASCIEAGTGHGAKLGAPFGVGRVGILIVQQITVMAPEVAVHRTRFLIPPLSAAGRGVRIVNEEGNPVADRKAPPAAATGKRPSRRHPHRFRGLRTAPAGAPWGDRRDRSEKGQGVVSWSLFFIPLVPEG